MDGILCVVEPWLLVVSVISAVIAAGLWLCASRVKTPPVITWGNVNDFSTGVARQSDVSKWAALFAVISALLQIPHFFAAAC